MGKGWVKASDLHIGDELRHILGQNVVLEKIDQEFGEFSVYNFEVEGLHNYYACDVLVHNCNEAPHAGRILRNEVGSVGTDVGQRISSQRAMRSTQALDSAGEATASGVDKFSRVPKSLQDEMVLDAAKEGVPEAKKLIDNLSDPRFKGMEKWEYKVKSAEGKDSVVHYVRDPKTGKLMDFKFKKHSTDL